MDYLKHLSASGQLLLEKDTLQFISAIYCLLKNKTEKKM